MNTATLVVQHNALVNARMKLTGMEMQLFTILLSRIGREDGELGTHLISVRELCPNTASKSTYAEVNAMRKSILTRYVDVEELGPNGERLAVPNLLGRPLMGVCDYLQREGMIRASFNEHMRPYLLRLTKDFTKATLEQLMKLRSPVSHRIYWLLRESCGKAYGAASMRRTIEIEELRRMLGMENEYVGRFDHFKVRVLDKARTELEQTDLAFTYTTKTKNRVSSEVVFEVRRPLGLPAAEEETAATEVAPEPDEIVVVKWAPDSWQVAVLTAGVSGKSLGAIQAGLDAGTYDEGYIRFVLATVQRNVQAGKVKKPSGAIFKGITEGYHLADYRPAVKPAVKRQADNSAKRRKLESELADARGSLKFIREQATEKVYPTAEMRLEAVARVEEHMAELQKQLDNL